MLLAIWITIGTFIVLGMRQATKNDELENTAWDNEEKERTGKPVIKTLKSAYPSNYKNQEQWERDSKNYTIVGKWKKYIITEANKPLK